MDREEFAAPFTALAVTMGRNITGAMADEYFNLFKHFAPRAWERICQHAQKEADIFPKPSHLFRIAEELGFRSPGSHDKGQDVWVVVECKCMASYAIHRNQLNDKNAETYRCPNPDCGIRLDAGFIVSRQRGGFLSLAKDMEKIFGQNQVKA